MGYLNFIAIVLLVASVGITPSSGNQGSNPMIKPQNGELDEVSSKKGHKPSTSRWVEVPTPATASVFSPTIKWFGLIVK